MQKGKFTKHYFEGATRVVSKLGEGTFSHKNTGIMAGGLDYLKRTQKEQEARDKYIKGLNMPPGPPTQHGIYTTPEWTGQPYPSIDWEAISQNQEPPEGWPRYPRFNEPGDVPGPPVQFGEAITNANVKAGYGFIPNGVEEKNFYYYHPDHLGSSSYITDKEGQIIQHTEYMAFGETFVDEHSTTNKMPYLFNGKELDYETGLYYYGARYYDAKTSLWLNVDPLAEKYPTMSPYSYVANNPINAIDPDGRLIIFINGQHAGDGGSQKYWRKNYVGDSRRVNSISEYAFDKTVMRQLGDKNAIYRDGASGGWLNTIFAEGNNLSSKNRINTGYSQGKRDAAMIIANLARDESSGKITETIKIITHSMGSAYGKGYVKALQDHIKTLPEDMQEQIKITLVADFAPYQPDEQTAVKGVKTLQFSHSKDRVAGNKKMKGAIYQDTSSDKSQGHSIFDFSEQVKNLPKENKNE